MCTSDTALLRDHLHLTVADDILSAAHGHETVDDVFDERIPAAELLDPDCAAVWGGQMLPDSIPVAGNGGGDVLLLRFTEDGSLREPVEWHHETGHWHPIELGDAYPCRVATLMRQADAALTSPFHVYNAQHGAWHLADSLGVSVSDVLLWLTDTTHIPKPRRSALMAMASARDVEGFFFQDWERARDLARECHDARPDLAWPGVVLGWVAERAGHIRDAVDWYTRSLRGFATTLAFAESWHSGGTWSFAAEHLKHCIHLCSAPCPERVQPMLSEPDPSGAVREYWMTRGRTLMKAGDGRGAYRCFFRAGWDWFFTNDMDVVLEHLLRAAELCGSRALTALARLHLGSARRAFSK